jgi:hypothetical protein
MNINTILLSTSLSLLFGIYSFYGFIKFFDHFEEDINEIYSLKRSFNVLSIEHYKLYDKYTHLVSEHNELKNSFTKLANKVLELDKKKLALKNCVGESPLEEVIENIVDENRLICHTPDSTTDNPKINIEIINLFIKPEEIDKNGEISDDSRKPIDLDADLDLDVDIGVRGFELLEQDNEINEHIEKSRSRGTSISEINWGEATKKFIFG